ncbi:ribosylnicotinamide kinase [Lobosporangium transversale]|uniref:p-loop containing nucleoside triphosphate hydrolase protein n=1 Tax=Lobosporangium transversale TaxID=64571 RepID=A0A1Y2GK62_9FUNG|nr:P-loop containing nucleoside triphosphate hydrolase protein [Lobosporangium transversale]KAF9909405.1 ribosylnicotinamide kinase [Lobosporangium transversale]ORZ12110.1 P-loop containing nucleoside triphosphate hydrolase protein [Lobosporangium transversale]|eukprot:XP_021879975.1 P-loop containing nucleoside triphosphate hydrolase protein [Lobosporangium transversale]
MQSHALSLQTNGSPTNDSKVITIGVSGPSSGGKTTTSRYLRSILPNSTLIHQDDFYLPEDQLPLDPKTGLANWDCPEAIDFTTMINTLTFVKEKGYFPAEFDSLEDKNPVGSNTSSTPIPDQVLKEMRDQIMSQISSDVDRTNLKFVILDGFLLYVNEQLRNTIDIKFFLTAPYQILKERRESRAGYATLEGYWIDPPGYFDDIVWPNYKACNEPFVKLTEAMEAGEETGVYNKESPRSEPMTQGVDIISSGSGSIYAMVKTVSNLLGERLSDLTRLPASLS